MIYKNCRISKLKSGLPLFPSVFFSSIPLPSVIAAAESGARVWVVIPFCLLRAPGGANDVIRFYSNARRLATCGRAPRTQVSQNAIESPLIIISFGNRLADDCHIPYSVSFL